MPTVAIALIRPQAENTKPPRALWVPFELGRPIGPPGDPAFQTRVVLAALGMLVEADGPTRILDFPDDDPRSRPDPAWQSPPTTAPATGDSAAMVAHRFESEVLALKGAHDRWVARRRRSTVGLSGLPIGEAARYAGDWLRGNPPPSPRDGISPSLFLRYAVDDLKAYCLEAGGAGDVTPSSRQLSDWFWNNTATGAACYALRDMLLSPENERSWQVVANFMVPAARLPRVTI